MRIGMRIGNAIGIVGMQMGMTIKWYMEIGMGIGILLTNDDTMKKTHI